MANIIWSHLSGETNRVSMLFFSGVYPCIPYLAGVSMFMLVFTGLTRIVRIDFLRDSAVAKQTEKCERPHRTRL